MRFGRRILVGGFLGGGGVLAAAPAGAAPASPARILTVKRLRPGDLIVGPRGAVLRVAEKRALTGGRYHVDCTDTATGRSIPVDARAESIGFDGEREVVVLLRGVPLNPVRFVEADVVIDGGVP